MESQSDERKLCHPPYRFIFLPKFSKTSFASPPNFAFSKFQGNEGPLRFA